MIEGTSYLTVQVDFVVLVLFSFSVCPSRSVAIPPAASLEALTTSTSTGSLDRPTSSLDPSMFPGNNHGENIKIRINSNLLECADYDVGAGPFTLTAFHDGVDGLTIDWIEVKERSQN